MSAFVGPCKKFLKRWTFDGKVCIEFKYSGCRGNGNRFSTLVNCKKACMKRTTKEESPARPNGTYSLFTKSNDLKSSFQEPTRIALICLLLLDHAKNL